MEELEQAKQQLRTVRDFIRWGASLLNAGGVCFGHGTDNAIDEAAALVLHALHLPPDLHEAYFDARLTDAERERVGDLLGRRVHERRPSAYLTREAWFAGYAFYVDERVLIPRSPMAELIERGFVPWLDPGRVRRILDLCTGSGCIAIACAHAFPQAEVDATDISTAALEVARINVERHGLKARVHPMQSDLFGALASRRYDLIVSNPPYVPASEIPALPAEYQFEPAVGLAAGAGGVDFAVRILEAAGPHLASDGLLVVEVGDSEAALVARFPDVPFLWPELQRGGGGVFVLAASELGEYADIFAEAAGGLRTAGSKTGGRGGDLKEG